MDSLCQIVLVGSRRLRPHPSLSLPVARSHSAENRAPSTGVYWCEVSSSMANIGGGFLAQAPFFLLLANHRDGYDSLGNAPPRLPSPFCDEALHERSLTPSTGSTHETSCHF